MSRHQEQLDNIEGTDSQAEENLQNASDAAAADQSYTSQTPVLYRTQVTLQFNGTYAGLKEAVTYLAQQNGRMTLDNVNASYDTSTGNLTGTDHCKYVLHDGNGQQLFRAGCRSCCIRNR